MELLIELNVVRELRGKRVVLDEARELRGKPRVRESESYGSGDFILSGFRISTRQKRNRHDGKDFLFYPDADMAGLWLSYGASMRGSGGCRLA